METTKELKLLCPCGSQLEALTETAKQFAVVQQLCAGWSRLLEINQLDVYEDIDRAISRSELARRSTASRFAAESDLVVCLN